MKIPFSCVQTKGQREALGEGVERLCIRQIARSHRHKADDGVIDLVLLRVEVGDQLDDGAHRRVAGIH